MLQNLCPLSIRCQFHSLPHGCDNWKCLQALSNVPEGQIALDENHRDKVTVISYTSQAPALTCCHRAPISAQVSPVARLVLRGTHKWITTATLAICHLSLGLFQPISDIYCWSLGHPCRPRECLPSTGVHTRCTCCCSGSCSPERWAMGAHHCGSCGYEGPTCLAHCVIRDVDAVKPGDILVEVGGMAPSLIICP